MNGSVAVLVSLALLALHGGAALAQDTSSTTITIEAIDRVTREPVDIRIYRVDGDEEQELFLGYDQPLSLDEDKCVSTVSYRIEPRFWALFSLSADNQRSCRRNAKFVFELTPTLSETQTMLAYAIVTTNRQPQSVDDPALQPGIAIIREAIAAGDYGTASYISNEMRIALEKSGQIETARAFRVINLATGAEGTLVDQTRPAMPILVPNPSGQIELSPDAKAIVTAYQSGQNITPDGRIDWQTMKALSSLAQEDIEQLSAYRLQAIGPIGAE